MHALTCSGADLALPTVPTRRSSDLEPGRPHDERLAEIRVALAAQERLRAEDVHRRVVRLVDVHPQLAGAPARRRSEEHTSELQSLRHLVCRLLLEKKN